MSIRVVLACLTLALCSAPLAAQAGSAPAAQPLEFFETRIRPVLAEHCFQCHGPKKQMSGLRLDSRAALLEGGDDGPAIVPGDADKSRLVQAVRQSGRLKMPPKGKLPAQAVTDLAAWVKMGAPWPAPQPSPAVRQEEAWRKHWAFQPVKDPPLPAVRDQSWPATSVDRFILAGLEAKGLRPSAPADRRTLIRRATFDLLGLPPTPEEVAAFEADRSPDAYAKLIDRLLASPHYGERWGRHWLDVARYADTKGYVFFDDATYSWAWTYRDYVIRAFNEDKPYDRFILEQLAADRLPLGGDNRPLAALGFLTVGARLMNNQHDILDDRIDVVTRGLLGLTVACARCHDHKYDPIPSRDYYSLYGVFASCDEPEVPPVVEEPPQTREYVAFDRELKARHLALLEFRQTHHTALVTGARRRAADYLLAAHALRDQPSTQDFMLLADGPDLNPTMILRWKTYLERTRKAYHPVFALWHAFADLPEKDFPARAAALCAGLPARKDPTRSLNPLVARAFAGKPPQSMADVARRYGALLGEADKAWQEARKRSQTLPTEQEDLRRVLYGPGTAADVAPWELNDLELFPDRGSQGKLQELRRALHQWRTSGRWAPPRVMSLEDLPAPVEPRVFLRGNPNNLGEAVPRQLLGVLAGPKRQPFTHGSGRLELARAIASRDNPLTARVLVNRVWMHHFGQGLVHTPSDFGLRSDPPSHPELLDRLARAFMDGGWSIKKLHRLIMLSRAYQQRSDDRSECRAVDPENLLVWRMNRRRLDFEATRDALLAVEGRLDRTVGGPSVRNIMAPGATRRTLYGFLDRLNVPGLYRTFDFPSPDATSPQRDVTTVAPQALFLMNNPFVLDAAARVAQRPDVAGEKELAGKVARIYRLLYGRAPNEQEVGLAREYLGATPAVVDWQRYVQALMLGNEFVFID
jgi:cytochrome c553